MTDAELVARAQRNPSAFGDIYECYYTRVFAFCYRRVGHRQDAEDVAMQTFLNAFAALPRYQERGVPFLSYLFRIANNAATRHHKRRAREVHESNIAGRVTKTEPCPATVILRHALADELLATLQRLSHTQRGALTMCVAHGLRYQDAATILGTTEGSIKQAVYHGRRKMRTLMEEVA